MRLRTMPAENTRRYIDGCTRTVRKTTAACPWKRPIWGQVDNESETRHGTAANPDSRSTGPSPSRAPPAMAGQPRSFRGHVQGARDRPHLPGTGRVAAAMALVRAGAHGGAGLDTGRQRRCRDRKDGPRNRLGPAAADHHPGPAAAGVGVRGRGDEARRGHGGRGTRRRCAGGDAEPAGPAGAGRQRTAEFPLAARCTARALSHQGGCTRCAHSLHRRQRDGLADDGFDPATDNGIRAGTPFHAYSEARLRWRAGTSNSRKPRLPKPPSIRRAGPMRSRW